MCGDRLPSNEEEASVSHRSDSCIFLRSGTTTPYAFRYVDASKAHVHVAYTAMRHPSLHATLQLHHHHIAASSRPKKRGSIVSPSWETPTSGG